MNVSQNKLKLSVSSKLVIYENSLIFFNFTSIGTEMCTQVFHNAQINTFTHYNGSSITYQSSPRFQLIKMKKLLICLLAAALLLGSGLVVHSKKVQKCYELMTRCPQILDPCPKPARCEENTTLSLRGRGCCCLRKH
jgi:hypothetical protein